MSSGIGVKGTIGRCYPFYADLRKCVVSSSFDEPSFQHTCHSFSIANRSNSSFCLTLDLSLKISFLSYFHNYRDKRMLAAQQECAGKRMRITLNAFTDSRKRSAFCKWLRNVNEERSLENHLILTSSNFGSLNG